MAVETCSRKSCPSSAALRSVIAGESTGELLVEVTGHLDECPGCQDRLDHLADDSSKISHVLKHIDQVTPPRNSAYWPAINSVEASMAQDAATTETPRIDTGGSKLTFLTATDLPGRIGTLGAFEIIAEVGRGGMGVVLHAFDPTLERDIAIKILDPQLASNDIARQRFCREARAAAAVAHDNIVSVYQVLEDEASGLPYMVMQLVTGESLEERIRRSGPMSVPDVVRIGMQTAAGLAAAHGAGLIHRDIKPGNILLTANGETARLTDFGLARAAEDMKLTRTGFVAGTPLYMAPEQARGDEIDVRADLFSLGSVLYEALAGKPPFDGKTPLAVLRRIADDAHPRLRRVNPAVPEWLEDVIDRLLEKEPRHRIQTASKLAEIMAAKHALMISSSREVFAAECTVGRTATKLIRGRCWKTTLALLGVPFLAGALAGGLGAWGIMRDSAEKSSSSGSTNSHQGSSYSNAPRPYGEPSSSAEPLHSLDNETGAVWSMASTSDGRLLAAGLEDGTIVLWNMTSGEKIENVKAHDGPVWSVDLTDDGNTMMSASDDGTVKLWDVTKGAVTTRTIKQTMPIRCAALNKAGDKIATGDRMGTVRLWDLKSKSEKPEEEYKQGGIISSIAFSAKGNMIGSVSSNKSVVLFDIESRRRRECTGHTGPVYGIAFSPDGLYVATASWDKTVRIWDTKKGTAFKDPLVHDEGVWSVAFSCCGHMLATAGQDGAVRIWNVDESTATAKYTSHKGTVHAVRFLPGESHTLLSGGRDGTVLAWNIE